LADWPMVHDEYLNADLEAKWASILAMRSEITKALETARRNKVIGHSLDAEVTLYANDKIFTQLSAMDKEWANILIVSKIHVVEDTGKAPESAYQVEDMALSIVVSQAEGHKCERCWIYSDTVGKMEKHETLCSRCNDVVVKL